MSAELIAYLTYTGGTFLLGAIITGLIAYKFACIKHTNDRREQVFEEVAVIVENGRNIANRIDQSFIDNEPSDRRVELWDKFDEIQHNYLGNKSRLMFLLNKYFGRQIATKVISVLSDIEHKSDKSFCEEHGEYPLGFVSYCETWEGTLSEDPTGEWDGYKWKMMKKCGMDITPYIEDMRKERAEWEAASKAKMPPNNDK